MKTRKIIAGIVLVDFAALNAYALYTEGISGLFAWLSTLNPWGMVLAADLLIALGMVVVWMWRDARANGRNPIGYAALTLASGSIAPLLYIVAGETADEPEAVVSMEAEAA